MGTKGLFDDITTTAVSANPVADIKAGSLDLRAGILRTDGAPYPAHDFEIGDIVVALVDNSETTLKRILYDEYSGSAYLHPENPGYPDIPVTDCQIQGVAVYVLKSLGASPLRRRR